MKTKKVTVSMDIVSDAYQNFVRMYHPDKTGTGFYLWNFVNGCGNYHSSEKVWEFNSATAKYLKMLAGPHHVAIAKMMVLNGHDPYNEMDRKIADED